MSVGNGRICCNSQTGHSLAKNAEANRLLAKPEPAFIVDSMLGSVARKLRFFGFDTWYTKNKPDIEVILLGIKHNRVILTCDKDMYKRALKLRAKGTLLNGLGDLRDIAHVFFIYGTMLSTLMHERPRCPACNGRTVEVPKSGLKEEFLDFASNHKFFRCCGCDKTYWEGSHYKSLKALSKRIDGRILELREELSLYTADYSAIPRLDFVSWRMHLA